MVMPDQSAYAGSAAIRSAKGYQLIPSPWMNFLIALGLGMLVGLERERTKGQGSDRRPAGIRTFTLAALFGALAQFVGNTGFLAFAVGCVASFLAIAHWQRQTSDPGLTTEFGVLCVTILGGLAMSDPLLAAALGTSIAVIFAAKDLLHRFVKNVLTDQEVNSGLIFAVVTLIIWPQLPNRFIGPYNALNLHNIWLLVILFLAMSAMGHIAQRALGARNGLAITGLAAGFVSSTAFVGTMGTQSKSAPNNLGSAVAGAVFSTVATFIQMGIVLLGISPVLLSLMTPSLVAGACAAGLYGSIFLWQKHPAGRVSNDAKADAFSIFAALLFATLIAFVAILAAALRGWLGDAGIIAATALAGLVDTHAATMTIASLVASDSLAGDKAVLPILAGLTTNGLAKILMAVGTGSFGFNIQLIPGLVLPLAAAWCVWLVYP